MTVLIVSQHLDAAFQKDQNAFLCQHPEIQIYCTESIENADQVMQNSAADLLVSDMDLPGEDGVQLFSRYQRIQPGLKYVCIVSSLDFMQTQRLLEIGCFQILRLPVCFQQLVDCILPLRHNIQKQKSNDTKQQFQLAMQDSRWRFVLEHQFWINLFMTKTSKNLHAVNEHIEMLGLDIETEKCYRPILLNIFGQKPFHRWDDINGLPQILQLLKAAAHENNCPTNINGTYYDDSRALFLFPDLPPPSIAKCVGKWLEKCAGILELHANCCIGRPRSFLLLCDEMPFLLKTSELQPNSQLIAWTDESEDKGNEVLIRTLKKYIDEHLDHELSRKELANSVFLSESYISHIWRSVTGSSLKDYITTMKIEQAKKMLRETGYSISQIALMLGYTHFAYFSSTFKKKTGFTPAEYRKQGERNILTP